MSAVSRVNWMASTITNGGATGSITISLGDVGTGSGRTVSVAGYWNGTRFPTIISAVVGGTDTLTLYGSSYPAFPTSTNLIGRSFGGALTVTGTQDLVITFTSNDIGDAEWWGDAVFLQDESTSAPTVQTNTGTSASANATTTVTGTGETGGREVVYHFCRWSDTGTSTSTPTNYTKVGTDAYGYECNAAGAAAGAASVAMSCAWNNPAADLEYLALAVSIPSSGGGGLAIPIASYYHQHLHG
jgi:hypothetical protein